MTDPLNSTDGASESFTRFNAGTFDQLADQWRRETRFASDLTEVFLNRSYQRIIGMGSSAVPLIVEALRVHLDLWFWALESIVGENPAEHVEAGDMEAKREAWLLWAKVHSFSRPTVVGV